MSSAAPRRLLYVLYRYPQVSQTFVRDEIAALRAAGSEVQVVSLDDPGPDHPSRDWAGPFSLLPRPSSRRCLADLAWWARRHPRRLLGFLALALGEPNARRSMLGRIPSLARGLAGRAPDHVHTHFAWSTATMVAGVAELLGVPRTITVHAKDIYAQPARVVRRRLAAFDAVVTVCHFNVGYMRGKHLLAPSADEPRMIPCGVHTEPQAADRIAEVDVVAVGRLVEKKGFEVLLRALARLPEGLMARAVIVGDGPCREELERLSTELGLTSRVSFTGPLDHLSVLHRISGARVFCLPSLRASDGDIDAMPIVLREALAHAVPVVASRLTGIPESVDETVGWLADPGSVDGLTRSLAAALGDPDEAHRRGLSGRARAQERWSFAGQATALHMLFAELAATAQR